MAKEPAKHFHIGEIRPGAGIAWIQMNWDTQGVPTVGFCGSKEPHNKIPREKIPDAIQALLADGRQKLIIETALR
jgi:hypothetical protein